MNKLKVFIRVASLAMLVAFVFGIVAFVKANKKGELKNLYKEAPIVVTVTPPKIDTEDFSRGIINPVKSKPDSMDKETNEQPKSKLTTAKQTVQKKAVKKKSLMPKLKYPKKSTPKIISFKSFSRGSLERMPIRAVQDTVK